MANKYKKRKTPKREKASPICQFRTGLDNATQINVKAWLGDKIIPLKIIVVIICISGVLACSSSAR